MKLIEWIGTLLVVGFLLVSCHYPEPDYSVWNLTREQRDSLEFRSTHHYGVNYNFKVLADSLPLREMLSADSLWVRRGDVLVVADFARMTSDTVHAVWIKVARDQHTMGWVPEEHLLESVVPVDPISQFIHWFSSLRNRVFLFIGCAFILFYLVRRSRRKSSTRSSVTASRVDSIYPAVLCICIVLSATLYASMQRFVPETWVHYYFNPTLNPFGLPLLLALFIASVWAVLLSALALVDDLFHQLDFSTSLLYLLGLGTLCLFLYMIVTWSVYYYVGYALSTAFFFYTVRYLLRTSFSTYVCGHCGARLSRKGVCPHCGWDNE